MSLSPTIHQALTKERYSVSQAQQLAYMIAFGPFIFQVSRLMVKYGIFEMLNSSASGLSEVEISQKTHLSRYAVKCLLEASLTMGTVIFDDVSSRYSLSRVGWFLLNDHSIRVDMDFNHDVNYQGLFSLDEALVEGKPIGLKLFGNWKTLYEGLSLLPDQVQKSWLAFDQYYSDSSFEEALNIVFSREVKHILDIGGNTGRFAKQCLLRDGEVEVTICDLPQQIAMMQDFMKDCSDFNRIHGLAMDVFDAQQPFPKNVRFDAIWMSQFLDCFSEDEIVNILIRVSELLDKSNRLYVMEPLWDRQKYLPSAFSLTHISLYFSVMANGNSKMYNSDDLFRLITAANLTIERVFDNVGELHSIIVCKKS